MRGPIALARALRRRLRPAPEMFTRAYSQQGEDVILKSLLQGKSDGFYVDIGAHHPTRYSNTYYLYLRGWSGINVDAMPGSMTPFRQLRPRDVSLEIGIAAERGVLPFYRFAEPAVNGFAFSEAQLGELDKAFHLIDRTDVPTMPLRELLQEHMPPSTAIDLLNVDAEGFDLAVLQSNDWITYRPIIIVAEDLSAFTLDAALASPISRFLREHDYEACAKAHHSIVYVRRDYLTADNIRPF